MKAICSVVDCEKNVHGRGLCGAHLQRLARYGDTSITKRTRHTGTESERFWKRVEKSDGCWAWKGQLARNGYGLYSIDKTKDMAHRYAYAELIGPIPDGYQLDHTCHRRDCVNPAHLRPVTNKQNNENPSGIRSDNTSGYRGVSSDKKPGRWRARAQHNGKTYHHPGAFDTPEEAAEAARQLRLRLFTHNDADRRKP